MDNTTPGTKDIPQQTITISVNPQDIANRNKPENNLDKLKKLSDKRESQVISLYLESGKRSPLHFDIIPVLYATLEKIGKSKRIDLLLRSSGGIAEVPWRIVSLIREYCDSFGVIVPEMALSGATHIAIAADELVLSELSMLGSVDPTRLHPLLPKDKDQNPIPISVQDLKHCIRFIKEQLGVREKIKKEEKKDLSIIIAELFKHVHPLAVGAIEQSYQLANLITRKVLETRVEKLSKSQVSNIENILGEKYFSHSFPICRKDVKNDLGLPVIEPDNELKQIMSDLHISYLKEFAKQINLAQQNQPPLHFKYIGFLDSIYSRKALCAIIGPDNQLINKSWVTL